MFKQHSQASQVLTNPQNVPLVKQGSLGDISDIKRASRAVVNALNLNNRDQKCLVPGPEVLCAAFVQKHQVRQVRLDYLKNLSIPADLAAMKLHWHYRSQNLSAVFWQSSKIPITYSCLQCCTLTSGITHEPGRSPG